MLPNEQHPQPGADSVWPPTMFHPRSTYVPQAVPHTLNPSSEAVQKLMNVYTQIMTNSAKHLNADEGIQWDFDHLSPSELEMIGHIFLALAQWKPSYTEETQGVTSGNQDGAGDSGDEFPGCNSVPEFPAAPKMPYLAQVGGV